MIGRNYKTKYSVLQMVRTNFWSLFCFLGSFNPFYSVGSLVSHQRLELTFRSLCRLKKRKKKRKIRIWRRNLTRISPSWSSLKHYRHSFVQRERITWSLCWLKVLQKIKDLAKTKKRRYVSFGQVSQHIGDNCFLLQNPKPLAYELMW